MNKILKVLLFLGFLWVVSYGVATLLFDIDTSVSSIGGEDVIAVIPVKGAISLEGGGTLLGSTTSGMAIVKKIEEANANPNVKGIVLEINSPGGTVMGSKVVADVLKEVDKPVVSVITEYGASGAYWIASQSDVIVADELSIVGSIGVLGSYLDYSGLLEDYNVSYQRLVTGKYKDISSPLRPMTGAEEDLVLARLHGIHDYFVADVAAGRGVPVVDIEPLADGLFYLGGEAVGLGLVDMTGNKAVAIAKAEELAGVEDGEVSEYVDETGLFDSIKEYIEYSSFFIGQGIGSVLVSSESQGFKIRA